MQKQVQVSMGLLHSSSGFHFFMALFKIVVWAIIFLTKLRFPPGISIATVLKDRLDSSSCVYTKTDNLSDG